MRILTEAAQIGALTLVCYSLFTGLCHAAVDLRQEAYIEAQNRSKEQNYKKFVGETEYPLPFCSQITKPLEEGQTVHFLGTVAPEPHRIEVNFYKESLEQGDIPMHISARWEDEENLVYNTRLYGDWMGNEQRITNPFHGYGTFDLRIRIIRGDYMIYGNRKHSGAFKQRMLLTGADYISVAGDLSDLRLVHYGGKIFELPYEAAAQLNPGKRLDLSAVMTGGRSDLALFNTNNDTVLHISIRFEENVIIRNSMINDTWGREEREGGLPIGKGRIFDLTIVNEVFSYQILLNGRRFAAYSHRTDPFGVDRLKLDGDIELHTMTINDAEGS